MAEPATIGDVPAPDGSPARPIRLAILDDNPFVRSLDGRVHPRAALFHRFAEAVVGAGPFAPAAYLVPVRDLAPDEAPPTLEAVDGGRLTVVPTVPFEGIEGYLRHGPALVRRNWPIIRDAIAGADLVWIKAPASNAAIVAIACRIARVPRFTWVAGSVRDVVRGQPGRSTMTAPIAWATAVAYDATTRLLERTGPAVRLDERLFTSVVRREELGPGPGRDRSADGPCRLVWAGRIAPEKGLDDLLRAMTDLVAVGRDVRLDVVGDGPTRPALERDAAARGLDGRVRWLGYIGDRGAYLDALRAADLFVLSSRAEGLPKVVVEAMAAGVPVVATRVGAVPALLDDGRRGRLVPPGDPAALAAAIGDLADDPATRAELSQAGLAFAAAHTAEAQAARLVDWLRQTFPALPWPPEART